MDIAAARHERLRLRPSPWRQLGLLAICIVFVVIGVMMIRDGDWRGWAVAGFFGLGLPAFGANLLPGASYLELDADGFRVRTLWREWRWRWVEVTGFRVVSVGAQRMVGWDHVPGYMARQAGRRLSRGLAGVESGLPGNYGLRPEELAALLEDWRGRHAADAALRPRAD